MEEIRRKQYSIWQLNCEEEALNNADSIYVVDCINNTIKPLSKLSYIESLKLSRSDDNSYFIYRILTEEEAEQERIEEEKRYEQWREERERLKAEREKESE